VSTLPRVPLSVGVCLGRVTGNGIYTQCPNAMHVADVAAAVEEGVVTWHAVPFNPQYEVSRVRGDRFASRVVQFTGSKSFSSNRAASG
jgi:hypothetical protein